MKEENKELKVGCVSPAVIGLREIDRALYLGRNKGKVKYCHSIVFRDMGHPQKWRFGDEDYEFKGGKLKTSIAIRDRLSLSEKEALEDRLTKAGL
jgi:hypothetical protein